MSKMLLLLVTEHERRDQEAEDRNNKRDFDQLEEVTKQHLH